VVLAMNPDSGRPERKNADLIEQLRAAAEKLAHDASSRGDLKLLARAIRELRYAFKVFRPFESDRKVSIFGSARTPEGTPDYELAEQLGQRMAAHRWLVITGAAQGIMEAGHRGAGRAHSMGLNILLPFEQHANDVIAGDEKLVHMKYFFTRKVMFVKESDAVVCLPGGFGTQDELFEVLTLIQTGKRDMIPIVLLDHPASHYWERWCDFARHELLAQELISAEDMHLFQHTHSVDEASAVILNFYYTFHSMRYVRDKTVFRLNRTLPSARLAELSDEFRSILTQGEIEPSGALPAEADEPELAGLPRLVFSFNRRNYGELRRLIDAINA
jgi:uncharacterized protein (TIGR00730 family)